VTQHEPHSSFIKTPKQLIVVILLSFLVPIVTIILIVQLVVGQPGANPAALEAEAVAARIKPVGQVEFGTPGGTTLKPAAKPASVAAAKPPAALDGKAIYGTTCVPCHAQSVAGSPKLGDKAAWAPRIQTGIDAMVRSVVTGKGAMPPKGANPALSEAQIRAAVEFMVSQSK
jgi:cytochrome c5